MRSTRLMITSGGALLVMVLVGSGCAQQEVEAPTHVDWPRYRRDLGGTGDSPLAQIPPGTVGSLSGTTARPNRGLDDATHRETNEDWHTFSPGLGSFGRDGLVGLGPLWRSRRR